MRHFRPGLSGRRGLRSLVRLRFEFVRGSAVCGACLVFSRYSVARQERLAKAQQTSAESKTRIVEQINLCLRSGDYSRALELLRSSAAEYPNDAELAGLEKLAHDGFKRNADANRLITESQELFAQQKSADAIQLLRKAYDLDKNNSLARSILANALVEHAHSMVETDWLEAEKLSNQALALNPAHPTAKTIRNLIADLKPTISVDDWVAKARKLQSAGDLFSALAWVAEGLAVHPDDSKLLQIQDAIQRDQGARRRQARRQDLKELRRMELEIVAAADDAARQALAERIQATAAKYWTDGEFLSIANSLLQRLGLMNPGSSNVPKGAPIIFHVPRASAPKPSSDNISPKPAGQSPSIPAPSQAQIATDVPEAKSLANAASAAAAAPAKVPLTNVVPAKVSATVSKNTVSKNDVPPIVASQVEAHRAEPAPKLLTEPPTPPSATAPSSRSEEPTRWNATTLMLASSAAAIVLVAGMFFLARNHAAPAAKVPVPAPAATVPAASAPVASTPPTSSPAENALVPAPAPQPPPTPAPKDESTSPVASEAAKAPRDIQPPAEPARNLGSLVIVAGQDGAEVLLNGKPQRQLTQAGQLRLPNLELKDYIIQVSKSGFQDPPQQKIRVRKGEETRLVFNLQPLPRLASLTIQGATPGSTVLVDQSSVGVIQPDGTLSVSTVAPGDHSIELRKDRFKPRQFRKHFVVGETISLAAADTALEAAPSELTITFAPADAKVAIVKGNLLKIVTSGTPLNLPAGTYTLTARTPDGFSSSSALEISGGQSRTLNLSLAPTGMSNWEDPGAWKHEKDSFFRKGGDFVLYGVAPSAGTFVFSGMIAKGHLLQWVLNYTDAKNYVLFQMDDNNFYRTVVRNGQKSEAVIVPDKGDKKSFRTLHIRVSATEIVHQVKHGDSWTIVDRWTQPGTNLSQGKFGFYIPGDDQVALSSFAHHADLNLR